jgi:hypothetical protein
MRRTSAALMQAHRLRPQLAVCDEPDPFPQIAAYNSGYAPLRGPKTYGLGHWAVVREAQRQVQCTVTMPTC